jgi:predicted phosphodiesterase
MNKTEIIKDYLTRYPKMASRTLSQMVYDAHPLMFTDVEHVRSKIRYYRDSLGSRNRSKRAGAEDHFTSPFSSANDYYEKVGRAHKTGSEEFIFEHKKPLILSDIHFPYHSEKELLIALEHGHKSGCDSLYLNGDVIDCHTISRFLKEGGAPTFNEEREMFWQFIEYVQSNWQVPIFYKQGNHEERWSHYLARQVPELFDVDDIKFETVMRFEKYGITHVQARQKTQMGKLIVIHGHEFGESVFSPVNPARGLFLRAKSSVLAGHNHQTSSHHENNLKCDSLACFSTGCLCQLSPNYRPFAYTKWNHGFAEIKIDDDGSFEVDNYRIIDGKVR